MTFTRKFDFVNFFFSFFSIVRGFCHGKAVNSIPRNRVTNIRSSRIGKTPFETATIDRYVENKNKLVYRTNFHFRGIAQHTTITSSFTRKPQTILRKVLKFFFLQSSSSPKTRNLRDFLDVKTRNICIWSNIIYHYHFISSRYIITMIIIKIIR